MSIPDDDEILELIAGRFRILGDPTRLVILRTLMAGEMNVTELCERSGRTQTNVSKNLKLMLDAGILARRKVGIHIYYRVADPTVEGLCELACHSVAHVAEPEMEASRRKLDSYGKADRHGRG